MTAPRARSRFLELWTLFLPPLLIRCNLGEFLELHTSDLADVASDDK